MGLSRHRWWTGVGVVLTLWALTGCATGPTEVLDQIGVEPDEECSGRDDCYQRGQQAIGQGRFDEGRHHFARACGDGHVDACRSLAHGLVLGLAAPPDPHSAARLLEWSCEEAGHGASCHDLGELHRRELIEGDPGGRDAFERACKLGEPAGCHDRALLQALEAPEDPQQIREAARVFASNCEQGLEVGCMNFAHLVAVAAQGGTGVDEAIDYFSRACSAEAAPVHPLAALGAPDENVDLFAAVEFRPSLACEQLEALATGLFEQRIIAAFDAEKESIRQCFEDGAGPHRQAQALTFEVDISHDGYGTNLREVSPELDGQDLRDCVQVQFARHLEDGSQAGSATFQTSWKVSYVGLPTGLFDDDSPVGCDADQVRQAVAEQSEVVRQCTQRYVERHPDQPGAALLGWQFDPSGEVVDLVFRSSVTNEELTQCLVDGVRQMRIDPYEDGACPLRLPLSFGGGRVLHFPVFRR